MPQPIIVGFDGSEHGFDALALGRALAETLQARLVVVIAYTPERWLWAAGTARPMDGSERELLVARAENALSGLERMEIRTVGSRSAAQALHAEAEREHAQILVVGSSHREGLGRLLLGTVSQDALDAAPCAVAVAPAGLAAKPPRHFSKIGVGFDDEPGARDALQFAQLLARRAGASLQLIWAAHLVARALPRAFISYLDPHYFREVRAEVEGRLDEAASPLRDGLFVDTKIVRGDAVAALLKASERLDLLILGSRGYGPLASVLLGSVSRSVVNAARCPVLIVPRTTSEPGGLEQSAKAAANRAGS